jgi:hypothetical protein
MTQDEIIEMAKQAGICSWLKPPEDVKERLEIFSKLIAAKEQDRCCAIVFSQCESDNLAQRTVDAIRGKA